jgi:mannitol-1-/sugar-/sorbitol-6-phosphatase
MNPFTVTAVLFDMDGTLVDSSVVVERIWTRWAQKHDLDPEWLIKFAHGRPTADTIMAVAPHLDALEEAAILLAEEEMDPTPVSGVHGAIDAIKVADAHGKWAVVTSASQRLARLRLSIAKFPIPECLISADDVENGKPHPEAFLKAAQQLHVRPEECIVFEDTPAGLKAARAAGAIVVGLATTFPANQLEADAVVPDFRSIQLRPLGDGHLSVCVAA